MGLRLIMCLVTHQLPLSHSENPPSPADAVILQITYSPNATAEPTCLMKKKINLKTYVCMIVIEQLFE